MLAEKRYTDYEQPARKSLLVKLTHFDLIFERAGGS